MRANRFDHGGVCLMQLRSPVSTRVGRFSRGLSIVELMVGIAVGMFVLAGASLLVSSQLSDNRLLLLETQVQQDLRATADLIARDMRRGGFWANAGSTVWPAAGVAAPPNPYRGAWTDVGPGGRPEWSYSYSSDSTLNPENNAEDGAERFGFTLNTTSDAIEMRIGGAGWQALTDGNVVRVTQFTVTPNPQTIVVPCSKACPGGGIACWPTLVVLDYSIAIAASAVHDGRVGRSIRSDVRLRNDRVTGSCPT